MRDPLQIPSLVPRLSFSLPRTRAWERGYQIPPLLMHISGRILSSQRHSRNQTKSVTPATAFNFKLSTEPSRKVKTMSEDQQKLLIEELKESTSDSNLEAAATKVTLLAAEMLLNQRAMLLPKLHSLLVLWLKDMPPEPSNSSASPPSTRWLLVRLAKQLSPHISFYCKIRKLGTVICRKDGDILIIFALSSHSLFDPLEDSDLQTGATTFPDAHHELATIEEASSAINRRLQKQAQKLLSKYSNAETLQSIRVTDLVNAIKLVLWSFLNKITRSVNDSRNRTREDSQSTDVKTIRQVFCLCSLLFCMNPRCNVPFHITLTDTIITQGGSTELCTILNRIGAAASVEAHKKLMDSIVTKREKDGMEGELTKGALNIVSIDNIDILQPGAQVYHSVHHRSWHGTSVHVFNPDLPHIQSKPAESVKVRLAKSH